MRTHGIESTYRNGCRCEICRDAGMEAQRIRRGTVNTEREHDDTIDLLLEVLHA